MNSNKHIIISLGGSLIVTEEVQVTFLKKFKSYIEKKVSEGYKCFIFTGGGKTSRKYVEALTELGIDNDGDKDWLGISATRLNAELIKRTFGKLSYDSVVTDPTVIIQTEKMVVIGGGWKPGSSSDRPPVEMAKLLGEKQVVNLSNIDYVYTADPKKDPNAKKLEDISWDEYFSYIPKERIPGMNVPFDPISAKIAQEAGISVAMINGTRLEEIDNFLNEKQFLGTRIHP